MGKYEIMDWLKVQRLTGNDSWFKQADVTRGMRLDGLRVHPAVMSRAWPDLLCHFKERIEYRSVGEWYNRDHVIRHRKVIVAKGLDIRRVHNTYQEMEQNQAAVVLGDASEAPAQTRPGVRHG